MIEIIAIQSTSKQFLEALRLRFEVFVYEQGVPIHVEVDADDAQAIHLLAIADNAVVGTLRMVPKGETLKIGRVAVCKAKRRCGIGRLLMEQALEYADINGFQKIVLDSQIAVVSFYEKLGFQVTGEEFMDAGIPHLKMVLDVYSP